jgi:hypothetical protein
MNMSWEVIGILWIITIKLSEYGLPVNCYCFPCQFPIVSISSMFRESIRNPFGIPIYNILYIVLPIYYIVIQHIVYVIHFMTFILHFLEIFQILHCNFLYYKLSVIRFLQSIYNRNAIEMQ